MCKQKRNWSFVCLLILLAFAASCGKKTDETTDKTTGADTIKVSNEDFTESDEDLLTVDYKEFYDQLAPRGEWIEVTDKDLGIKLKGSASNESGRIHRTITFSEFFGIKDAYADDINFGSFFIWKPAADLSIGVTAGDQPQGYQPYTNGEWVNTDAGWYFKAPTPEEEVTSHYGRWVNSPSLGWTWMPGKIWAPAWVDWKENETYVAWTPIPPSITIVNNVIMPPPVVEENYIVVEKKHFGPPDMYKYMYKENKNKIMIKEWKRVDGVMVKSKTVINKGPDVNIIRTTAGKPFEEVKIVKVNSKDKVKYSSNEYVVYTPEFKKVKVKTTGKPITKPGAFVTYENAKVKYEKGSTEGKDKEKGKEEKEKGKEEKEKGKEKEKEKEKEKGKEKEKEKEKEKGKEKEKEKEKEKDKDKGGKEKKNGK